MNFSCRKDPEIIAPKEEIVEIIDSCFYGISPQGIDNYDVYTVDTNLFINKIINYAPFSFDLNCDKIMDFRIEASMLAFSPWELYSKGAIVPLHADAYVLAYSSIDTTYSYKDTVYSEDSDPNFVSYFDVKSCRLPDDHHTYTFTINNNAYHLPYLSNITDTVDGEWVNKPLVYKDYSASLLTDLEETIDTFYYWGWSHRMNCYDIPEGEEFYMQLKVGAASENTRGYVLMTNHYRIKEVGIRQF